VRRRCKHPVGTCQCERRHENDKELPHAIPPRGRCSMGIEVASSKGVRGGTVVASEGSSGASEESGGASATFTRSAGG